VEEVISGHSMLTAYNALAMRCWEDPDACRRFSELPREALAAYGWEVPEETAVRIEFVELGPEAQQVGPDQIVAHWRHGLETGELVIKIAAEPPPVESAELGEDELTAVSAGAYSPLSSYPR
jgi:hypothetical protein